MLSCNSSQELRRLCRLGFFSILSIFMTTHTSYAKFQSEGMELVVNTPVETQLQNDDLRSAAVVWEEMFASAKHSIDIAQFYVYNQSNSSLDQVLNALHQAGERGVKIRFLLDQKGVDISNPETIQRIQAIPHLELRIMDFSKIENGIIHAKYFVVDDKVAFVGSQNFDWRALTHIHETGLAIHQINLVQQIARIFQVDWINQARIHQGKALETFSQHQILNDPKKESYLLASPAQVTPNETYITEEAFPKLIATAQSEINIQVMQYSPLSFTETKGKRAFYPLIDNSLRAAAAKGVKVNLMVADWNVKEPDLSWLKSLALIPNIHIKIVTIPKSKQGFIPFARVVHSKYMTIDHHTAWVGTSNWSGGYFDSSRNLEVVLNDEHMARRLDMLYEQLWTSPYAQDIDVQKKYMRVNPAKE